MNSFVNKDRLPEYAWATLFDAFSIALSYPTVTFYEALKSGDFSHVVKEAASILPDLASIEGELNGLQVEIGKMLEKADLQELESTYISLFEVNRRKQVMHLYAYLFASGNENRVASLQRLQEIYHQYGLEVGSGNDSESPDHLVVQLEFLSYLLVRSGEAFENQQEEDNVLYRAAIGSFLSELDWVDALLQAFSKMFSGGEIYPSGYPMYLSLLKLLSVFVQQVRSEYLTGERSG